ncbi:MAG: glycosyltransferase family 4 protein [Flavobacteriales bacterium]|nr:glycosyltransferase family 4 protein [Flavobacteriales bacterium]
MRRRFFSKTINYTIYYFRRIVLFQSKEKAMREHYVGYIKTQEDLKRRKTLPNIAIVNQSFTKYTETFIREKIKNVDAQRYYVRQYYGGLLPQYNAETGHLLSKHKIGLKAYELLELFLKKPTNYYLKKAFTKHLKREKIKLVFAEFGTIGIEIYESCKFANVPLIVTLRGYDIHHSLYFKSNEEQYLNLFDYASLILCVSNEIVIKVNEYGFSNKTKYFHSTINIKLFNYSNHKNNPPIFLAIGRFAETKSPHLTILAFNEVLKEIPGAELRMIGKDGGGELFEACHILVKALGIADKVQFLGVKTPEEVANEMQHVRVFVQHSLTTPLMGDKEGTPVSIMEAMASGLPIVSTKHAGIAELIENNISGVLVDEYDYLAMAKEMVRVCKNDELVEKLGLAAAKAVQENELIQNNTQILSELIEKYKLP